MKISYIMARTVSSITTSLEWTEVSREEPYFSACISYNISANDFPVKTGSFIEVSIDSILFC